MDIILIDLSALQSRNDKFPICGLDLDHFYMELMIAQIIIFLKLILTYIIRYHVF